MNVFTLKQYNFTPYWNLLSICTYTISINHIKTKLLSCTIAIWKSLMPIYPMKSSKSCLILDPPRLWFISLHIQTTSNAFWTCPCFSSKPLVGRQHQITQMYKPTYFLWFNGNDSIDTQVAYTNNKAIDMISFLN